MSGENSTIPSGTIAGTVTGPFGETVAGAVVMITGESPAHLDIAALTDDAGRYRFDDLEPGRYTLLVNAANRQPQSQQVSVEAGRVAHLDFALLS